MKTLCVFLICVVFLSGCTVYSSSQPGRTTTVYEQESHVWYDSAGRRHVDSTWVPVQYRQPASNTTVVTASSGFTIWDLLLFGWVGYLLGRH